MRQSAKISLRASRSLPIAYRVCHPVPNGSVWARRTCSPLKSDDPVRCVESLRLEYLCTIIFFGFDIELIFFEFQIHQHTGQNQGHKGNNQHHGVDSRALFGCCTHRFFTPLWLYFRCFAFAALLSLSSFATCLDESHGFIAVLTTARVELSGGG